MTYRAVKDDGRYLTRSGRLSYIAEKAFTTAGAEGYGILQRAAKRFVRDDGGTLVVVHVESGSPVELIF